MDLALLHKRFPLLKEESFSKDIQAQGFERKVSAGFVLMESGSSLNHVPLILEGNVKIYREEENGKELFLYNIFPGETCAASILCCYAVGESQIRAVAEDDVRYIAIPVHLLDSWFEKHKAWRIFVLQTYQARFEELLSTLDSIAFLKMDDRLVDYLQRLAALKNSKTLELTHQEIANDMGSTREVISRLLKQLEKKGLVQLGRNRIELI